jgi:tRNA1Val (adenine37-N6)-methyltransferase
MGNSFFKFKQFVINQQNSAMKVGVDAVLLGAWANPTGASTILDIGTGTGLLSLMLAQKSNANITAIEIDEETFNRACDNIKVSRWNDRISLIQASFQVFVPKCVNKFDFIICNPPFFNSSLIAPDAKRTMARHDQSLSLDELFLGVNQLLDKSGQFVMIYPFDRKDDVLKVSNEKKLFASQMLEIKGNEKKIPNRIIFEFVKSPVKCNISEIIVRNSETNDYTDDYKLLTKDYYLNF